MKQHEHPLQWVLNDDLNTVYANQIYITVSGAEFYLIFGEVQPGPPETQDGQPLTIKPVARIAVSLQAMPAILQALERSAKEASALFQQEPPKGKGKP